MNNVIVTKRLTLRPVPVRREILNRIVGWLSDPEVVQFSEQRHRTHTPSLQKLYVETMHLPNRYMGIYYKLDLVGTINAHVDEYNSVANVGIMIGEKQLWGQGIGREAWKAFCDDLLENGVRKIESGTMSCNFGMIKIFRVTGMTEEGRRGDHFLFKNNLVDLVQYARFH